MAEELWGEHRIATEIGLEVGDVSLSVKEASEDELWVSSSYGCDNSSESPEWTRWALKKKAETLNILPVFPDKAVVVKPENAFRLLPGVEARIYVRVPVWLAVKLNPKDATPLVEIPSAVLSLTWFGSPIEGELCYWISSSAKRKIIADAKREHLAICPVRLKNTSSEDLLVEKLCLRVKWLSLYEEDSQLWANETRVFYRGGDDMSQVSVASGPPKEVPDAKMVNSSREVSKKSFSMRTFFGWGDAEPVKGVEPEQA